MSNRPKCPVCDSPSIILTTWNHAHKIYAQLKCEMSHIWYTRSTWDGPKDRYVDEVIPPSELEGMIRTPKPVTI